jgi:hypothetical protein
MDVVGEDFAELVAGHLADERALRAERGEAGQRVGSRAAGGFPRRAHRIVQHLGPRRVDQGHAATIELELLDQLVAAGRYHVDDCVADRDHVVSRFVHGTFREIAGGCAGQVGRHEDVRGVDLGLPRAQSQAGWLPSPPRCSSRSASSSDPRVLRVLAKSLAVSLVLFAAIAWGGWQALDWSSRPRRARRGAVRRRGLAARGRRRRC